MNRAFPEIYKRLYNSLEASGDADLALQQITDGQRALEKNCKLWQTCTFFFIQRTPTHNVLHADPTHGRHRKNPLFS